MPLLQYDRAPFLLQGVENQPLVAKLIRDRAPARNLIQKGFQGLGMSPGQQAVQVPDLRIQLVVSLRADCDNAVGANYPDVGSHFENTPVGDFLAVPNVHKGQFTLRRGVDEDGGDDQGTKIVSLAGLIDTDSLHFRLFCRLGHKQGALVEIRNEAR